METDIILPDIVFVLPEYDVISWFFDHVYIDIAHYKRPLSSADNPGWSRVQQMVMWQANWVWFSKNIFL